jgi:hypothetical protein
MTHPLLVWLEERLAEAERIARAATPGPWRWNPEKHWRKPGTSWFEEAVFAGEAGASATCVAGTGETDDPQSMADAQHIALHDPAAVLALVEAHRMLLELHANEFPGLTDDEAVCASCGNVAPGPGGEFDAVSWPCPTVRALVSAYRHAPGWDEAWGPT